MAAGTASPGLHSIPKMIQVKHQALHDQPDLLLWQNDPLSG